jgi:hypothetical protein
MGLMEARNFLLGAYHDLPNVLFMGSLVLGAMTGYLPLVWVALGLVVNGGIVASLQGILRLLFPDWAQVSIPAGMGTCSIIRPAIERRSEDIMTVAPSHWLSAAVFFAVFSVFNSIQVAIRPGKSGVDSDKVSTRRAVSMSAMVVGMVFLALVLARGFTGCETWLGSISGVIVGAGTAIGYWFLLDLCGSGTIPDILQIVEGSAPATTGKETAVVCN